MVRLHLSGGGEAEITSTATAVGSAMPTSNSYYYLLHYSYALTLLKSV